MSGLSGIGSLFYTYSITENAIRSADSDPGIFYFKPGERLNKITHVGTGALSDSSSGIEGHVYFLTRKELRVFHGWNSKHYLRPSLVSVTLETSIGACEIKAIFYTQVSML